METKETSTDVERVGRRAYVAPCLVRLGKVTALTAAGSGKHPEKISTGTCGQTQKSKPCV